MDSPAGTPRTLTPEGTPPGSPRYSQFNSPFSPKSSSQQVQKGEAKFQYGLQLENFGKEACDQACFVEARSWYSEAAAQGHPKAKSHLAGMYLVGKGGDCDPKKAHEFYLEAANAGDQDAMCALGKMFEKGVTGVKRHYESARFWYEKAHDNQYPEGSYRYAKLYIDHINEFPWNTAQTVKGLLDILQQAGEDGCAEAYYYLGNLHKTGLNIGVVKSDSSSTNSSASSNSSLTDEVVVQPDLNIGVVKSDSSSTNSSARSKPSSSSSSNSSLTDEVVVQPDLNIGVVKSDSSSTNSSASSNSSLTDEVVVQPDDFLAMECYRLAAEGNHVQAMWEMGYLTLCKGDQSDAVAWFRRAENAGSFDAMAYFVEIDAQYKLPIELQQLEAAAQGGDHSARYLRALLHLREGNEKFALALIKGLASVHPLAMYHQACLERDGKAGYAKDSLSVKFLFDKAKEIDPNVGIYFTKIWPAEEKSSELIGAVDTANSGNGLSSSSSTTANTASVVSSAAALPDSSSVGSPQVNSSSSSSLLPQQTQSAEEIFNEGNAIEEKGEPDCLQEARKKYLIASSLGHTEAAYRLAGMCLEGRGGEYDPTQAYELYSKAAKAEHTNAMCAVGEMLEKGIGTEKDVDSAKTYYLRARALENIEGHFHYGRLLIEGDGLELNVNSIRDGLKYVQEAAAQKCAEAQYYLGTLYETGLAVYQVASSGLSSSEKVVPMNAISAAKYFGDAAFLGHAAAMWKIGYKGLCTSLVPESISDKGAQGGKLSEFTDADEWIKKAAQAGSFDAMAHFMLTDKTYRLPIKSSVLKVAAKAGDDSAKYLLALVKMCQGPVEDDNLKEVDILEYMSSAASRLPIARYHLAYLFSVGKAGIAKEPVSANIWLEKAEEIDFSVFNYFHLVYQLDTKNSDLIGTNNSWEYALRSSPNTANTVVDVSSESNDSAGGVANQDVAGDNQEQKQQLVPSTPRDLPDQGRSSSTMIPSTATSANVSSKAKEEERQAESNGAGNTSSSQASQVPVDTAEFISTKTGERALSLHRKKENSGANILVKVGAFFNQLIKPKKATEVALVGLGMPVLNPNHEFQRLDVRVGLGMPVLNTESTYGSTIKPPPVASIQTSILSTVNSNDGSVVFEPVVVEQVLDSNEVGRSLPNSLNKGSDSSFEDINLEGSDNDGDAGRSDASLLNENKLTDESSSQTTPVLMVNMENPLSRQDGAVNQGVETLRNLKPTVYEPYDEL